MRAQPGFALSLVACAIALAFPGSASALGLGRLTVNSALGQPLSARIDLTASREELDSLTARIADPSLYRQNNLTYHSALARTRVMLERNPDGSVYLSVTSPVAVSEPFLDLMVEANWASGRVVREYTFLLDPPGVVQPPVEPVAPARVGSVAPARGPAAAAPSADAPVSGEPYTVKRGDTLSKIATQVKPADVSLDQMLVALFKANSGAFDGNNMNRLRTGAIMTISGGSEAQATPAAEATTVVRVQAADWRAYRDRVAAAAPTTEGEASRTAGGRIGTAVQERVPAAAPGGDQLRVSREAAGRGATVAEEAVARDKALREAQARITELEKTIKDLQRAIELRSPTMAQVQAQADAAKGKAVAPAGAPAAPPTVIAAAPTPAPAPVAATKAPETKASETRPIETAKAPEPAKAVEPAKAPEPVKAAEPVKAPEPKVEPPKAAEPVKAPPKVAPKAPAPEPSFLDDLMSGASPWAVGGGALGILALIAGLIAARRRKTTKFEDSIISGTDIKTNTVFGSTGGGVVNTGDNSLASDFSREGLGNIDTDEVDPIAEAEVYLAYGRDAQAEEILKDALKKDPQRQEIYLKLLEIHAQHNKPSAFETVASELYSICQGQGEVWQKAVSLGRQLDPNNPMFSEGGAPPARPAARAKPDDEGLTIGADIDTDMGTPARPAGGVLDMQLDEEISVSPTSGAKPKTPADILAGAEEVLEKTARGGADKTRSGAGAAAAGAAAAVASLGERVESARDAVKQATPPFDMDFKLDDAERPTPLKPRGEPRQHAALATAVAEGGLERAPSSLTRPVAALELDKLDLSFNPDQATFEDPTPSVLDGQWHDAATKLDLAKAYQEMGDVEGARKILQEVLHEGDDQQKAEAQGLMAKLG